MTIIYLSIVYFQRCLINMLLRIFIHVDIADMHKDNRIVNFLEMAYIISRARVKTFGITDVVDNFPSFLRNSIKRYDSLF